MKMLSAAERARMRRNLLAAWNRKRGDRAFPSWADFDVVSDLRPFLGHLILSEALCGDWWFRVFGTEISNALGEERQGKRLSQLRTETADRVRGMFEAVVECASPMVFQVPAGGKPWVERFESLHLPLSNGEAGVHFILSLVLPVRKAALLPVGRPAAQASRTRARLAE